MVEALLMFPLMWSAFALWSIASKIENISKQLERLASSSTSSNHSK